MGVVAAASGAGAVPLLFVCTLHFGVISADPSGRTVAVGHRNGAHNSGECRESNWEVFNELESDFGSFIHLSKKTLRSHESKLPKLPSDQTVPVDASSVPPATLNAEAEIQRATEEVLAVATSTLVPAVGKAMAVEPDSSAAAAAIPPEVLHPPAETRNTSTNDTTFLALPLVAAMVNGPLINDSIVTKTVALVSEKLQFSPKSNARRVGAIVACGCVVLLFLVLIVDLVTARIFQQS
eukprot:TRINITY_DN10634_c0_g1_i1.p1 TRINITY_DN10634_c0_g1~~TRINITY_DN10634_c0_g1_i1.p1  ORF type:complete len:238 (-),score=39.38 TRINITY_DN10634_c0_g1_i1:42-755(-)